MRLSADPNSPHWRREAAVAVVYLDGAKQSLVIEADEDGGWLRRYRDDVPALGPYPQTEVRCGAVRIELRDNYTP